MVVAATGFFDGVHKGHRKVLEKLCEIAKRTGKKSAVITFWPHPRSVLQQGADGLRLLNSLEEKKELIRSIGINKFIVIPFSKEFSLLSTDEFLQKFLKDKYEVSSLIIGYDHRLGHNTGESQEEFINKAENIGISVERVDEFSVGEKTVSSTKIRALLAQGQIEKANSYLGYYYPLKGVVISGKKLGRKLGFPTANMGVYEPLKAIPSNGVYGVKVKVLNKCYYGICNIGLRPTVGEHSTITIETFILDFNEDIYGLDINLEFIYKIRDELKFKDLDSLILQMKKDEECARAFFIKH